VTRVFVELPEFQKAWHSLGLNDDDLSELEIYLTSNPEQGNVIAGTGGLRKLRWAAKGKGKRGGARVLYIDLVILERIYFVTAYSKNEKLDLTPSEKKEFKSLIHELKSETSQ